jgi:Gas vesicle protein G
MGLVTGLLGLPLSPLWVAVKSAEQVLEAAEDAFYDPAAIRAELAEVDRLRGTGEITDDEATLWEDELVDRLVEASRRPRKG